MEMLTNILLLENLAQQSYDVSCGVFKPCTQNTTRKLILYSNYEYSAVGRSENLGVPVVMWWA